MSNAESQFQLDAETIGAIIEVLAPLAEELIKAIMENTSKLDQLLEKVDQLFLRDIKSGFEALGDGLASNNLETRKLRLEFAEKALLNNTVLQQGSTGGQSNEYLMAQCHYGLSIIASEREDAELAVRHVLRAFAVAPFSARKEFFPKVFSRVFDSQCADIYEWNKTELIRIDNDPFSKEVRRVKLGHAGGVALGVGAAIGAFFAAKGTTQQVAVRVAAQSAKDAYAKMEKVSAEEFRTHARDQQRAALELRLDERCRNLAKAALNTSPRGKAAGGG